MTDGRGRQTPGPFAILASLRETQFLVQNCAKRSQFAPRRPASAPVASAARAAGGAPNRAKRTQFPPEPGEGQVFSEQRVMVNRTCEELRQNEANLPPWAAEAVGRGQRGEGGGPASPEQIVRNEPNCPKRGTEAVSRLRIVDCGQTCGETTECAKRSQFRRAEIPIIPPFQSDANRAKRTQLGPAGRNLESENA